MKKITTPVGVAVWPSLLMPTNFKGEGDLTYDCKLKLPFSAEETTELLQKLEESHAQGKKDINEQRARFGEKPLTGAQLKKEAPKPWTPELNDEGDETGNVLVKAKLKAERKVRGQMVAQRPAIFDEFGKAWDQDTAIWGGSKLKLSVEPRAYFVAAIGYGITLQLKAAQVLELVNSDSENLDAEAFGFSAAESSSESEADAFEDDGFTVFVADDL